MAEYMKHLTDDDIQALAVDLLEAANRRGKTEDLKVILQSMAGTYETSTRNATDANNLADCLLLSVFGEV